MPFFTVDDVIQSISEGTGNSLLEHCKQSVGIQLAEQNWEIPRHSVAVVVYFNFSKRIEEPLYNYYPMSFISLGMMFPKCREGFDTYGGKKTVYIPTVGAISERIGSRVVKEDELDIYIHTLADVLKDIQVR